MPVLLLPLHAVLTGGERFPAWIGDVCRHAWMCFKIIVVRLILEQSSGRTCTGLECSVLVKLVMTCSQCVERMVALKAYDGCNAAVLRFASQGGLKPPQAPNICPDKDVMWPIPLNASFLAPCFFGHHFTQHHLGPGAATLVFVSSVHAVYGKCTGWRARAPIALAGHGARRAQRVGRSPQGRRWPRPRDPGAGRRRDRAVLRVVCAEPGGRGRAATWGCVRRGRRRERGGLDGCWGRGGAGAGAAAGAA